MEEKGGGGEGEEGFAPHCCGAWGCPKKEGKGP